MSFLAIWFKSKFKGIINIEQAELCDQLYTINNRNWNFTNRLAISLLYQYFRKSKKLAHVSSFDCKHNSIHHRNCLKFFINSYKTKGEAKQRKLEDHYDKLNENVLRYWLSYEPRLGTQASLPDSSIPLYVNIVEKLKEPIHFSRLKSHLDHADYKELNQTFEHIERIEPLHNQKVAKYIDTLKDRIKQEIHAIEKAKTDCIIKSLEEYKFPYQEQNRSCYALDHIIRYYKEKAQGNNAGLVLENANEQETVFRIYRITDGIELGRGDRVTMNCLYEKIIALEKELVSELKVLIHDANATITLFNSEFKTKVKDLMADIDDNYVSGECVFEERLK